MSKVLIVDDDPIVLAILARALQSFGADVVTCREIEAAEAALDLLPVSKIVTDLRVSALGGLEGTRLLRHAALHHPDVQMFAVSGYLDARIREILTAMGVVDAFEKPCDPRQVASKIVGWPSNVLNRPGQVQGIEPLSFFLASGRLHSLLTPIVSLRHGAAPFAIHGFEALPSAPDDCMLKDSALLFNLAQRKDRLAATDLACVRAALQEARQLGGNPTLFIRAHPGSLATPGFAQSFAEEVAAGGRRPSEVVIELSGRRGMPYPAKLADTLAPLRRQGFQLSLDNYGEGDSNLDLLLELRPDYVKLAGVLTEKIDVNLLRREVLHSTQGLMARLGIRAILSRVETATELRTALDLGFEFGQGWQFGRPGRAEDLRSRGDFFGPAQGPHAGRREESSPFALPA